MIWEVTKSRFRSLNQDGIGLYTSGFVLKIVKKIHFLKVPKNFNFCENFGKLGNPSCSAQKIFLLWDIHTQWGGREVTICPERCWCLLLLVSYIHRLMCDMPRVIKMSLKSALEANSILKIRAWIIGFFYYSVYFSPYVGTML